MGHQQRERNLEREQARRIEELEADQIKLHKMLCRMVNAWDVYADCSAVVDDAQDLIGEMIEKRKARE